MSGDQALFGLYEYCNGKLEIIDTPGEQTSPEQSQEWTQPAILYVHGWQPNAYKSMAPDSFVTSKEVYGEERDVALPWIEAGYRVLCFLWVPYADEADVATAEQKIWASGAEGAQRRRLADGSYEDTPGVGGMGAALFEVYCRTLATAPRIHLVGHSLGCQMVGRLLEQLLAQAGPAAPLPQRVTLLDPYFTNFAKSYLDGKWTGERVREAVRGAAERGCAVEQVGSSAVLANPLSDSNDELRFHTAYYVLNPDFIKLAYGPKDVEVLANRHAYARFAYFASFGLQQPSAGANGDESRAVGLADRTDAEVRRMMTSESHWIQVEGRERWDPGQLIFERRSGSGSRVRPPAPVQYA